MRVNLDFSGKKILITGACGGIGVELCRYYLDAGAGVCALDVDERKLIGLRDQMGAHSGQLDVVAADITDVDALESALAALEFDALIANAGAAHALSLKSSGRDDWRRDIELNVNGTYHCVSAVLPAMQRRGNGAIVIIGSVNAVQALGHPGYSAAKAALVHYTKSLALEYGPAGIRVNMVSPGTVRTKAWDERALRNPRVFEELVRWYPLGRFAEPLDIACATAFLLSDMARAITGVTLPVDGGLCAGNRMLARQLTLEDF